MADVCREGLRSAGGMLAGSSVRDAFTLAGRLTGARLMSVVTLLAAAFLIDIEAFAAFGAYQTLAMLVALAIFLRFDVGILAAKSDAAAGDVLRLCAALGGTLWLVVCVGSIAAVSAGAIRPVLGLMFPLTIFSRALLGLMFSLATRSGDFHGIGRASLVQSIVQPSSLLLSIALTDDGTLCLAAADVIGHSAGLAYLAWCRRTQLGALLTGWARRDLMRAAQEWRVLPAYNLPGSFLSLAFTTSPLLIMPLSADAAFAGHVALAYRIFDVVTQIITAAATPIFLHRLRPATGGNNALFGRHMLLALVVMYGAIYGALAAGLIFADPWLEATRLANLASVVAIVAAYHLFLALAAPLNNACALYPQQRRLVLIHGVAVMASVGCGLLALSGSPRLALFVLTVVACARALALGEFLRLLSGLNNRRYGASAMAEAPVVT